TVADGATPGNSATLLDWNPGTDYAVNTLAVHNNVLYAGGFFTQAGGQTRGRLAAFTVANGATPGNPATLLNWNPGANSSVETLAVHHNVIYAGGQFTQAGGQTRERLAAFTVANGATSGNSATLLDWNPGADRTVYALTVSPEAILAGGDGGRAGRGRQQAQLNLAAFDHQGNLLPWNPGANNRVRTLAVHNNVLYAGGIFSQAGGQARNRLAAFTVAAPGDAATLLDWNPGADGEVFTLAVHDNVLYAGGSFTQAGGQPRERLAAFTVANGATAGNSATLMDWNPGIGRALRSHTVSYHGLYAGGDINSAGGQDRERLAGVTV